LNVSNLPLWDRAAMFWGLHRSMDTAENIEINFNLRGDRRTVFH